MGPSASYDSSKSYPDVTVQRGRMIVGVSDCRCQNRQISRRGAQAMRLRINGNKKLGDTVFTQVRALIREVKSYSCLIIFHEYEDY